MLRFHRMLRYEKALRGPAYLDYSTSFIYFYHNQASKILQLSQRGFERACSRLPSRREQEAGSFRRNTPR